MAKANVHGPEVARYMDPTNGTQYSLREDQRWLKRYVVGGKWAGWKLVTDRSLTPATLTRGGCVRVAGTD